MSTAEALDDYPRRYCPACRRTRRRVFRSGPGGRPDARCPGCGSLERQRFLALLLDMLRPSLGEIDVLLDVAPSRQTTPLLRDLRPRVHTRLDLGADNRLVDVLGSLTELPYRDRSVDLLVCYHVLEHIPDDRAAMREIARVLADDGVGLLQVPYRPGTLTDEDPSADVAERLRRFGQADHVRYYGDDIDDRLVEAGLSLQRLTPRSVVGARLCEWLKLRPDEVVWLVRRGTGVSVPLLEKPTALATTMDVLVEELAAQHALLREARGRVRRLEHRRDRLLGRVRGLQEENARLRAQAGPRWRRAAAQVKRRLRPS